MKNIDPSLTQFRNWNERTGRQLRILSRRYGEVVTRMSFAFVFITFGLQKVIVPGPSPVDEPIMALAATAGVGTIAPLAWAPVFVGLYEVVLGACFLRDRLGLALVLFVPHQAIAFSTLLLVPSFAFNDPIPFAYDHFGAFVLKNVVFVGAFALLFSRRVGDEEASKNPPAA